MQQDNHAAPDSVRNIVIVGGGTAGWMTAAALSKLLPPWRKVRLIESDDIGTVGVGEATIPMIRFFNSSLGIDEDEFIRQTRGTFKLGIEFVNWGQVGERYIHGFGKIGQDEGMVSFYHYWLKQHQRGLARPLEDYSINTAACHDNKFMRARHDLANSPLADIAYAFHFDAALYARFLRDFAVARGVHRTEGIVAQTIQRGADGFIEALVLDSGERVEGDLFIDCSGFRGLLIEQALQTGYDDWTHWLPCDRAVAVPCEHGSTPLLPYTRSTAHAAGWQWRIPLQHRIGNGHVFSSKFMSEDEATSILLANLDGPKLAEPRTLKFVTGKRKKFWNKNVIAVGLASGFMEPLESTSIHLIQSQIARIATFFPDRGFAQADIDEFNRQADFEFERIRDFLILHYQQTRRTDSAFWNYVRTMPIPDTLQAKLDLYRSSGRIFRESTEMFTHVSWLQVMHGQGVHAGSYHPLVDNLDDDALAQYLDNVSGTIAKCVEVMPTHAEVVSHICSER
ncbi:tryptophan halogenase family protein [Ideonella margarita]|uniref:Tryptophan halogenase family protein n=1 Tax=Ideonella margarita TaxID=2984191 RepID=A0ABU9C0N6_9BURK